MTAAVPTWLALSPLRPSRHRPGLDARCEVVTLRDGTGRICQVMHGPWKRRPKRVAQMAAERYGRPHVPYPYEGRTIR